MSSSRYKSKWLLALLLSQGLWLAPELGAQTKLQQPGRQQLVQLRSALDSALSQGHRQQLRTLTDRLYELGTKSQQLSLQLESVSTQLRGDRQRSLTTAQNRLGSSLSSLNSQSWLSPQEQIALKIYSLYQLGRYEGDAQGLRGQWQTQKVPSLNAIGTTWTRGQYNAYLLHCIEFLRGMREEQLLQTVPSSLAEQVLPGSGLQPEGHTYLSLLLHALDALEEERGPEQRSPEALSTQQDWLAQAAAKASSASYTKMLWDYLQLKHRLRRDLKLLPAQAKDLVDAFVQKYQRHAAFPQIAWHLVTWYSREDYEAVQLADRLLKLTASSSKSYPEAYKQLESARYVRLRPWADLSMQHYWGSPDTVVLQLDSAYLIRGLEITLYQAPKVYTPLEQPEDWMPKAADKPLRQERITLKLNERAKVSRQAPLRLTLPLRRNYYLRVRPLLDERVGKHTMEDWTYRLSSSAYQALMVGDLNANAKTQQWLEAATGRPLSALDLSLYRYEWGRHARKYSLIGQKRTDSLGFVSVAASDDAGLTLVPRAATDPMRAELHGGVERTTAVLNYQDRALGLWLTTDRPVYRPGQKLQVYGEVQQRGFLQSMAQAQPGQQVQLKLENSYGVVLWSEQVTTDSLGRFATSHQLPTEGRLGTYTLKAELLGASAFRYLPHESRTNFQIIEYKRQALELTVEEPAYRYAPQAKVQLHGQLKRLSGDPLPKAQVRYTVQADPISHPWRSVAESYSMQQLREGTVETDSLGGFTLALDLGQFQEVLQERTGRREEYTYRVSLVAEDATGDRSSTELLLRTGQEHPRLVLHLPELIDQAQPQPQLRFASQFGESLDSTQRVDYSLYRGSELVQRASIQLGQDLQLPHYGTLAAGLYTLRYQVKYSPSLSYEGYSRSYIMNSRRDKQLPGFEHPLFTLPADSLYSAQSRPCLYWMSALEGGYVYYILYHRYGEVARGMLRSKRGVLERLTLPLPKSDTLPDELTAQLYTVYQGKLYNSTQHFKLQRHQPQLSLRWTSFRDRIEAGSQERWSVQLLSDGKPLPGAAVTSWMYDAALDEFGALSRHYPELVIGDDDRWSLHPQLPRGYGWNIYRAGGGAVTYPELWNSSYRSGGDFKMSGVRRLQPQRYEWSQSEHFPLIPKLSTGGITMTDEFTVYASEAQPVALSAAMGAGEMRVGKAALRKAQPSAVPRQNFAETAYFLPSLVTDAEGMASWIFRMPEALTRWRMILLAHTRQMQRLDEERLVTSYRHFALRPQLPRFLRRGDKLILAASLVNMSEQAQSGKLSLELFDLRDAHVLSRSEQPFELVAGQTAQLSLALAIPQIDADSLGLRLMAVGQDYSDGEQHRLALLSDETQLSDGQTFTFASAGTHRIALDSLLAPLRRGLRSGRLELQLETAPLALALGTLPQLAESEDKTNLGLAASLYAEAKALRLQQTAGFSAWLIQRQQSYNRLDSLRQVQMQGAAATPWAKGLVRELAAEAQLLSFLAAQDHGTKLEALLSKLEKKRIRGYWPWLTGDTRPSEAVTEQMLLILLPTLDMLPSSSTAYTQLQTLIREAIEALDFEALDSYKQTLAEQRKDAKAAPWNYYRLPLRYLWLTAQIESRMPLKSSEELRAMQAHYRQLLSEHRAKAPLMDLPQLVYVLSADKRYQRQVPALMETLAQQLIREGTLSELLDVPLSLESYWRARGVRLASEMVALFRTSKAYAKYTPQLQRWILEQRRTATWSDVLHTVAALEALTEPQSQPWSEARATELRMVMQNGSELKLTGADRLLSTELSADYLPQGRLELRKQDATVVWGSARWHYSLPTAAVEAWGDQLKIELKQYLVETKDGVELVRELEAGDELPLGARLRTKVLLQTKLRQELSYLRVRIPRPGYAEPVDQTPRYDWRNNLYIEPRDGATDLYIDRLNYQMNVSFDQWVSRRGTYSGIVAQVESLYAPEYSAHTTVSPEQLVVAP